MPLDQTIVFRKATSFPSVLRQNSAHQSMYGRTTRTYRRKVKKWREHFNDLVIDILKQTNTKNYPVMFRPLAQYFDGFNIHYVKLNTLPDGILSSLHKKDEEAEGWHLVDGKDIYIIYNSETSEKRQRFTIAHEWGHICQQFDEEFKADMESIANDEERNAIIESVANHFAGCYLAPDPFIARELAIYKTHGGFMPLEMEMANSFNVSFQCMEIRYTNYQRQRVQQ